jgi:hypothetical protein
MKSKKYLVACALVCLSMVFVQCSLLSSNHKQRVTSQPQNSESNGVYNSKNLIIYYDAQTGKDDLLKAIKLYGAKILYQYDNMNAVAISIPDGRTLNESIEHFKSIKGVISVNKDYIMKLD